MLFRSATSRKAQGTGASRRLRKAGRVPGIVYGSSEPTMIELDHNKLYHALRKEAFHASILTLDNEGKKEQVLLRDFQMHPFRQQVMHIDFERVIAGKKIHMKVPLHFINADIAPGVKSGGVISHVLSELTIACLPKDLLEFIEVDLADLALGHSIHVSDIKLPKTLGIAGHHHAADAVVTVQVPRGAIEAATTDVAETDAEAKPAAAGAAKPAAAGAAKPAAAGAAKPAATAKPAAKK